MDDHLVHDSEHNLMAEKEVPAPQTPGVPPVPFVQDKPAVPYEYAPPAVYAEPVHHAPLPYAPPVPAKVRKGVPGATAFGFTSALLSLFLFPLFKEAFSNYLLYEGTVEALLRYYYYASWVFGGASALFGLLGLVLTPIGGFCSKRRQSEGRGLAVAGTLIAFVALILTAGIAVSHYWLFTEIFPS